MSRPEGSGILAQDKDMQELPHVLDVNVQFTPVHNFLPEKGISSPFILTVKSFLTQKTVKL